MKKFILLSAVIFCCLNLHAQPGELDSAFGINGIVNVTVETGNYTAMVVQADGKILVGGIGLARYKTDGSLDSSFGGGIVYIKGNFLIGALAVQSDGKIIVATRAANQVVNLTRLNINGSLDISFDEDGMKTTTLDWGSPEEMVHHISIVIQSDNKILVAADGAQRYNQDGSLDMRFYPGYYISSLAVQSDGKIIFLGFTYNSDFTDEDFALARYNSNGTIDPTFSNDGFQTTDFGIYDVGHSIAIQSDGKIVVAGNTSNTGYDPKFALARYNTNGTVDNLFGDDGKQTEKLDSAASGLSVAIQADGKIIAGGYNYDFETGSTMAIVRYNIDGTLDNSFSNDGKQITPIRHSIITAIAIANNKLYTIGETILARYQLFNSTATSVRITSPYNTQSFTALSTINISASASAPGGTISKVDFYNGTTLLFSDDTSPYSFAWENVPAGNYILTAKATDDKGLITTSPQVPISVVPDKAPIVSITSPYNNAVYRQPAAVTITADAADGDPNGTITKVDFYNGSTLIYTDSTSPYAYTWENLPVGDYAITAKATDNTGNATTSSVGRFSMKTNNPPVVSITTPANNEIFEEPATISIGIAAKDSDDYIWEAYFYSDTTLIHFTYVENHELDYSYDWTNVPAGNYTLTVKVIDNWGLATTSAPVHVKVIPKRPTVTITSPSDNTVYGEPAAIFIGAKVTSQDLDGAISKVEFYNGARLLHTDNSAPFNYTWNNVLMGNYTIIAKTTFSSGLVITSDSVHISVIKNKPSPISISTPSNILVYAGPARIRINAIVTDPDSTIEKVELYRYNGYYQYLTYVEHKYPYGFLLVDWPVGNYTFFAKAIDKNGNVSISNSINVSVVDYNVPPIVSILSPANDTTYTGSPATIRLIANAKDPNDRISKVEFYNGTTLLRTEYIHPYTYTWTNVQPGNYTVTAKAYDDKGLSATSDPVTITVTAPSLPIVKSKPFVNDKTDLNGALSLRLSPNPASNTLQIYTKGLQLNKPTTISVISASGVVLKTVQSNASNKVVQLDISSLVRGAYTIKVMSGNNILYKQFIRL